MRRHNRKSNSRLLIGSILLILLLAGCAQSPESCPELPHADLSEAAAYAGDDRLPFRFPLDEVGGDEPLLPANFCEGSSGPESSRAYHAAEDFHRPAGTPVYAMADGEISFSGRMGGYGWLIIIDHPQVDVYSLYGHLSPSRWRMKSGPVEKGDLIAYLGDPDENGGSAKNPLTPHLHLGVRAGQRADYSGMGEWRWQAGWIVPCPRDVGWLQPSAIITSQEIPAGGFPEPAAKLIPKWGTELLFTGIYIFGGACMAVYATKQDKPFVLVLSGGVLTAAGWIFRGKGARMGYVLFAMAVLFAAMGVYRFIRPSIKTADAQS